MSWTSWAWPRPNASQSLEDPDIVQRGVAYGLGVYWGVVSRLNYP